MIELSNNDEYFDGLYLVIIIPIIVFIFFSIKYLFNLNIVYLGDNNLKIINTYKNKIDIIPFKDIDDIKGSILRKEDIIKIILKEKNGKIKKYYFAAKYRFFKFYSEHKVVEIIKEKINT